jgi:triosephosphate isomerase (TIM)
MARRPFVAGNWKMNKTVAEAVDLVKELKGFLSGVRRVDVAVAPPYPSLTAVGQELGGSLIRLAAQNVFWEEKGAFTGEVSPLMLKEAGCEFVIVGHSERRQFFGETDETVNRRLRAALRQGLKPIFCVGESLKEREAGRTFAVIGAQIEGGLMGLAEDELAGLVVAYEPVWAIGTGKTATPGQAEEVHRFIRENLERLYAGKLAGEIRIQYGGSVTPENVKALMAQENIDGALVGGASLKAEIFAKVVRFEEI